MLQGYQSQTYTKTFEHLGRLRWLNSPLSGVVLERDIPFSYYKDLCSLYPVFTSIEKPPFQAFNHPDFTFDDNVVSLTIITDPLDNKIKDFLLYQKYGIIEYKNMGFDSLKEFKQHYIVNLQEKFVIDKNHVRNIKKSIKNGVTVSNVTITEYNSQAVADEFYNAYSVLCQKHNIIGFPNFNNKQIHTQLTVPGTVLLKASLADETLGFILFYLEYPNVRYHLGCYTEQGYENCVSFLLMYEGMSYFKQLGFDRLVLGASAGTVTNAGGGLDRFKAGWTSYKRPNYLLFKVTNSEAYARLSDGIETSFLPAYRRP